MKYASVSTPAGPILPPIVSTGSLGTVICAQWVKNPANSTKTYSTKLVCQNREKTVLARKKLSSSDAFRGLRRADRSASVC